MSSTKCDYLHEFFSLGLQKLEETKTIDDRDLGRDKVCVIFDNGLSRRQSLSYKEVDDLAAVVTKKISSLQFKATATPGPGPDSTTAMANSTSSTDVNGNGGFVGVACPSDHLFPSIQLGILRSGHGFFNLGSKPKDWTSAVENATKIIPIRLVILTEDQFNSVHCQEWILANCSIHLQDSELLFNYGTKREVVRLRFLKLRPKITNSELTFKPFDYAYLMQTSGTTGRRKYVLVPHFCIVPNILDFIKRVWKLNSKDVILGLSPSTFDPSVCDLFCSMGVGGTILYTNESLKHNGKRMAQLLLKNQVSVVQITPSLLRKIGDDLKSVGFFTPSTTHLKVLALGGEKCLAKEELRRLIDEEMFQSLRNLVNLYGLTEMSCWASSERINLFNEDTISVGEPILQTEIRLEDCPEGFGQIVIESRTRICTIVDEAGIVSRNKVIRTGDFGILRDDIAPIAAIEFLCRKDNIVKRSGMKVPLSSIEKMALDTGSVKSAHCALHQDKIYLVLVPLASAKNASTSVLGLDLGKKVRAEFLPKLKLDIHPELYPNCIIAVHSIPLTENGKIDILQILEYLTISKCQSIHGAYKLDEEKLTDVLCPLWLCATGNRNKEQDQTALYKSAFQVFLESGGTSASAVWLVEALFSSLRLYGSPTHKGMEINLLSRLLDTKSTFKSVIDFLIIEFAKNPLTAQIAVESAEQMVTRTATVPTYGGGGQPVEIEYWPGTLSSGGILSEDLDLPHKKSRLETSEISYPPRILSVYEYDLRMCVDATAAISYKGQNPGVVIIGSHSGMIIAIDTEELRRHFNKRKRYDPKVSVKSNVGAFWAICLDGRLEADVVIDVESSFAYIGCHDKNVYKLSIVDGSIASLFKTEGSIRTKVALLNDLVIVVDDSDHLYCLKSSNLKLKWKQKIQGLRSTCPPILIAQDGIVIVTTVRSGLVGISLQDGSKVWSKDSSVASTSTTAPVLMPRLEGDKNLVVYGTRTGLDIIDGGSGHIVRNYKDEDTDNSILPFPPLIHTCQFNKEQEIFLTYPSGRTLRVNNEGVKLSEIMLDNPTTAPVLFCPCPSSNLNLNPKCFLLSKPRTSDQFLLYDLDLDYAKGTVPLELGYHMEGENFSVPQWHKDMLIFGGRDNKLHIIFCDTKQSL